MGMNDSFKAVLATLEMAVAQSADKIKLCSTAKLKSITDPDLKEFLQSLYNNKDPRARAMAPLINSVLKESTPVFLLSNSIWTDLLKQDKELKRNSIGGDYRAFWSFAIGTGFFKILSQGNKESRSGTLLELSEPNLLQCFGQIHGSEKIFEQRRKCIEVFDRYLEKLPRKVPNESSSDSDEDAEKDNKSDSEKNPKQSFSKDPNENQPRHEKQNGLVFGGQKQKKLNAEQLEIERRLNERLRQKGG